MSIIDDQQAPELALLIDEPQQARRSFSTVKAFKSILFQTAPNILIIVNVSWHKGKTTNRHNCQPMVWPPNWSDLNPIEGI